MKVIEHKFIQFFIFYSLKVYQISTSSFLDDSQMILKLPHQDNCILVIRIFFDD
jgi:hypothetical protein